MKKFVVENQVNERRHFLNGPSNTKSNVLSPGNLQSAAGINGSIAGVTYNGVDVLTSYLRRDFDFKNVAVEMGGDVTIKEREWITIEEST